MKPRFKIVISDTSCLILLSKIKELELLTKLFDEVYTTFEILEEFRTPLPDWIRIKAPKDDHYQKILELEMGKGEASAISLYFEIKNSIIILDDLKARKLAEKLSIDYTGTFGIVLRAKKLGIIKSVKPILAKIRNTNFRFSENVFETVLKEAGEF